MKPGDIARTNLSQPGGLVRIIEINTLHSKTGAFIEHIEDHPYGYKKGERGWYLLEELVKVENMESYKCEGC